MRPERPSALILTFTAAALAAAGLLAVTDFDSGANLFLILVAVVPLIPLLNGIVTKLRRREPGVDIIALIAVASALALGELLAAAIIGLMLATGQFLEEYAAGRAERELTALVNRAPRTAHLVRDGVVETVKVGDVGRDDRVLVKSGEVVPVDGVVLTDVAVLDESALTGEPLPVEKRAGDLVSSGTVNAADIFELRAKEGAEQSTYAGIVRLVESARRSRAPAVRLADRWAGWFVPVALGTSGLAWLVSGDPTRALAVLVVATPCPLLLAVPIALVSGISRAARRGVVFRSGGSLEQLAQTQNLVIDKTGTVTMGKPSLHSVHLFDTSVSEAQAISWAASVEQASSHVLARSVVEAAQDRNLDMVMPFDVTEVHGAGVSGTIDNRLVSVGKLGWVLGGATEPPEITRFRRRTATMSPTAVYVAIDGRIVAGLVFDDRVRPDAAQTIRALRRAGIERVVMATGDHPLVARSVGVAIGVDDTLAEATPEEKVGVLEDLKLSGITAMVGDGINDAPALAAAHVGVAMGARGTTASSEAADVVLIVDRFDRLVDAISIAQRSRTLAAESVVIGMGLSLAAMAFASFGYLVPIVGALVQEGIDVVAILNSLRALGGRTPGQTGPRLPTYVSDDLRREHDKLIPQLDGLHHVADALDHMSPAESLDALRRIERFLTEDLIPHEAKDETEIYPQVAEMLPGEDPMALMSRTHREIFHLVESFRRQVAELPKTGPDPADIRDLRRTLYGLHAILRLHFDHEEELYASLEMT